MRKLSFIVAVLAAISTVVVPVAPASAATGATTEQKLIRHAERGEAAILSKAQLDRLAKANPALHTKLMTAYQTNSVPSLTPVEKKAVQKLTDRNLSEYKAGYAYAAAPVLLAGLGWIPVALIGFVLLLILWWIFQGGISATHRART
jgi:hypothetical protein